MLKIKVVVAITLFVCCGSAAAQAQLSTHIDTLAQKVLSQNVAGISIAVARNGRIVFARGYGMANAQHSVGVTTETVFHIDSISKNILSAVLLQLVDQGKLSPDDDVTKYVPEAPTHGHRVTLRQLLNHTSGIYSFTSLPEAAANERLDLTHDQVLSLFRDRPFDFEPGTEWRYNNSAFYIGGMVVERITKQDYGIYVRDHVFKPLGMNTAQLCDARMVVPHLASGYDRDHGMLVNAPFLSWKLPWAAGAICATATDLVKWQAALDDGRVLSASSLKLMQMPTVLTDGTAVDYGLGTRLGSLEGHRVIGHTGSGGGFTTAFECFPDDHLTVVVLTNTEGASALTLASSVARAILGLAEKRSLSDLPVPTAELAALSGTFDSDEGAVENVARNGKLFFRVVPSGAEGRMLRQSENVYAVNENTEVHFIVRNGRAVRAIVYTGGLMMNAARRAN